VLKHWASAKISRAGAQEDEDIRRAIVGKFEKEGEKGVSYAEIAKKAWEAGRIRLATMVRFMIILTSMVSMVELTEPPAAWPRA